MESILFLLNDRMTQLKFQSGIKISFLLHMSTQKEKIVTDAYSLKQVIIKKEKVFHEALNSIF